MSALFCSSAKFFYFSVCPVYKILLATIRFTLYKKLLLCRLFSFGYNAVSILLTMFVNKLVLCF